MNNEYLSIGQFRKEMLPSEQYMTIINSEKYNIDTIYEQRKDIGFSISEVLSSIEGYYLNFSILKTNEDQFFSIYLLEKDEINIEKMQLLKTIKVPKMQENNEYITFDMTFSPVKDFSAIYFKLQRNNAEEKNIEINAKIYKLKNLIGQMDGEIKRFGVQGPINLLMNINGEEIRIGRSGIYNLIHNMKISFLGIVVDPNEKILKKQYDPNYFIIDYQY